MKNTLFLTCCFWALGLALQAQSAESVQQTKEVAIENSTDSNALEQGTLTNPIPYGPVLTPRLLMQPNILQPAALPAAFSYDDLCFFCKMEYKIDQKVPLMIRLGEVKSTERMEGKGNDLLPHR